MRYYIISKGIKVATSEPNAQNINERKINYIMATCIVKTGNDNGVNIRPSKSTSGNRLGVINNGVSVNVVRCDGTWATLMYNGTPAFVQHKFLQNPPTINGDGLSVNDAAVSNGDKVNIRDAANGNPTGKQMKKGENHTVLGKSLVGSFYWYKINTNQWVRGDYLTPGTSSGGNSGESTGGGSGGNTATWEQVLAGSAVYKKESSSSAVCEGVKTLQNLLKAIGYGAQNVGNIVVDGNFGSITESAVKHFQKECGLTADGVVGKNTANKLVTVQNNTWFTRSEYYPLKKELMTYSAYPKMGSNEASERSIVMRAIASEHGYASSTSTGHKNARIGVAKVMLNRTRSDDVTLANPKDHSFRSVYLCRDYTSKTHEDALYLPRGYSETMQQMHDVATTVVAGNWPSGAEKVTTAHLFQKGAGAYESKYDSHPGYCRYPETGNQFSFFYIS